MCNPPSTVQRRFLEGRVVQSLPKTISIGRNDQGEWLTARLKIYPPALCRVLSTVIHDYLLERGSAAVPEDLPMEWEPLLEALRVRLPNTARRGPDYHPVIN